MLANLEIRELPEGLSFRAIEPPRLWRILWAVPFTAIAAYFLARFISSSGLFELFLIGVCVVASAMYLIADLRGTNVELRVTNLDLVSAGRAPDGYRPSSIPRASIYNLEFREARGVAVNECFALNSSTGRNFRIADLPPRVRLSGCSGGAKRVHALNEARDNETESKSKLVMFGYCPGSLAAQSAARIPEHFSPRLDVRSE